MTKISFLIAAHNEEGIIAKALSRLAEVHQDYPDMEVLIGLDGCTDGTADIAREFVEKDKCFRLFTMDERKGKQAVLDKLEPHITGDIIIVHDADWVFAYKDSGDICKFIELFDDEKVGGIISSFAADYFPQEIDTVKSIGFLASGWGNHFLMEYTKKRQTKRENNLLLADEDKMIFPFFLDVYRKTALEKTKSRKHLKAGDHLERTLRLLSGGYDIIVPEDRALPRMQVTYREQSVRDLTNQKVRGAISKGKIKEEYKTRAGIWNFYIPFFFYILMHLYEAKRLRDLWAIFIYCLASVYAQTNERLLHGKEDAKSVWAMRIKR